MWSTNRKVSKWIDIAIENPFKTWWKARKYFKRPKLKFRAFFTSYKAYKRGGRLLEIECFDIMWKDKFNSPRHEISPHISVLLFGKLGFRVDAVIYYNDEFGERQNGDMEYWEYLLEWLYYKKERTLRCYSSWTGNSRLYRVRHWGKAEDGAEETLAASQGFYGRLLFVLSSDEPDAVAYLNYLEEQNFKDTVDLVMFLES